MPHTNVGVLSALRYNRKLWLLLFGSMADPANPLDTGIKQNVANLAAFVIEQSMTLESVPEGTGLRTNAAPRPG